jgi:hypothetical protein
MPPEGRGLHKITLSEDTSAVLRNGGTDGNEIRKNSGQIGTYAEAGIHIVVSSDRHRDAQTVP